MRTSYVASALLALSFLALAACGRDEGSGTATGAGTGTAPAGPPTPSVSVGHPTERGVRERETATPPDPIAPAPDASAKTASSGAAAPPARSDTSTTWYEQLREGKKIGWIRVVWTPTTREGVPGVHDTTTFSARSGRDMLGQVDVFSSETVSVTDRGLDGALWRTASTSMESGTVTRNETVWTGDAYVLTSTQGAGREEHRVATDAPVPVDAEAFLGDRVRARTLAAGDTVPMPILDGAARRIRSVTLRVVGEETVADGDGKTSAWRVLQTDPETGSETSLWFDAAGVLVRYKEMTFEIRRTTAERAKEYPEGVAAFAITTEGEPTVERIFSADRALVDVRIAADPDRPLPEFPTSPFGRVRSVETLPDGDTMVHAEFLAHDVPDAKATVPVEDPAFAKYLEDTVLFSIRDPRVVGAAKRAIGDATDARTVAARIADFVFTLRKQSLDVEQGSAVRILEQMCGDCSEHALLFVALCRAVGLPARRCSGFVCVGGPWGGHAWAEVWTGAWIGVDPTTNDVGTAARYLFYGYSDDPDSRPGLVSARASGRLSFRVTEIHEGPQHVDLRDEATWRVVDLAAGRASHRLAGIDLRGIPKGWRVELEDAGEAQIEAPGLSATLHVRADQGYRSPRLLRLQVGDPRARAGTYAGAPAVLRDAGGRRDRLVASRRRIARLVAEIEGEEGEASWATLEKVLAPTFAAEPPAD